MTMIKTLVKYSVVCLVVFLSACTRSRYSQCGSPDPQNPGTFVHCSYGSGVFGTWIVDAYGLPAYKYTLDEMTDPRALWWNSAGADRREHWHQIGNERMTAAVYNDGYTQLFSEENGFKWLNYFDSAEQNYAGGFSYLSDNGTVWPTAYAFAPVSARTTRVFGMDYFRTETAYDNVSVTRTVYAPYGDDPLLLADVEIKNTGSTEKHLTYYEYWDVNLHQMLFMPVASGVLSPGIPAQNEQTRDLFNDNFTQSADLDGTENAGIIHTYLTPSAAASLQIPAPGSAKQFDDSPPDIFLVPLDNSATEDDGFVFDQTQFFGTGNAAHPGGIGTLTGIKTAGQIPPGQKDMPGLGQTSALIHIRKIDILPGQSVFLRYGYGYTEPGSGLAFLDKYRDPGKDYLSDTLAAWKQRLAYFADGGEPVLQREMAWDAYYLQSGSYYRDYFQSHIISQGGTYLFGHGFDGASRDYCIFAVPLVYLNPGLAKEILGFVMMTTTPDGQMAYANNGDVALTDIGVLSQPSDLDIFFLWAMSEYLNATRDYAFLDQPMPFYKSQGILDQPVTTTVYDHVRTAFDHLVDVIGTGPHNLIRIQTGDWSDGILYFTNNPAAAQQNGESTFDTAFAAAILPSMADALAGYDPVLSSEMRSQAVLYRSAMSSQWAGQWYVRGWDGEGNAFGVNRLFLEPQAWALIAGIPGPDRARILIGAIHSILDAHSPAGARIVYPPKSDMPAGLYPGTDVNGGIWHAMDAVLTWAYSLYRPDYAWQSLEKNTLAAHAEAYPGLWYGIWSGPDSYNAPESARPGQAAAHDATDLTAFPVMNMNQHANPLIAMIKLAGIFPGKDGISISPAVPADTWTLLMPLIGVRYSPGTVSGYYSGTNTGVMVLQVELPQGFGLNNIELSVDGQDESYTLAGRQISFSLAYSADRQTSWLISHSR